MDLISRLRRRQAFGSTDGAHWLRLAAPDQDCQDAADEIERLKHDIERHIAICGTQEQEIARLTRERDAAMAALEIIAGKRQCVDNLMSNVEIALCALEQQERSLDYQPITGKGVDALDRRTPEAMAQVQDYIRERMSTGEPVGLKPLIRRGEGESDGDTDLSAGSPVPTLEQKVQD